MSKKIIYIGLGSLGKTIAGDLASKGLHEFAAAVDPDPAFAGKTLDEFVAGAPNIPVHPTLDAVEDLNYMECAIVTTLSTVDGCMDTFRQLLGAGVSVVTTCEEMTYPWLHHPDLAAELDDLAQATGTHILGTGVNPGFLMDAFPAFATSVCRSVSRVKVERFQDATHRRGPFQQKIGAGLTKEGFQAKLDGGDFGHVGLGESLHLLANHLGLPVDSWNESIEPVLAKSEQPWAYGAIAAGDVTGIRQIAKGLHDGNVLVELAFQAAVGLEDPHDTVYVTGDPNVELTWKGGVHGDTATSAMTLNVIRPLLQSPPGLHTMTSITSPGCSLKDENPSQLPVWHQTDNDA